MRVAGLFAGIGGLELPFHRRGHQTQLLCDVWEPARTVLEAHFDAEVVGDVREIRRLPDVDVVNAGFPCTDLSQAGRTAGIHGEQSGLVGEVFRLLQASDVTWLVLENVRNMLWLDGGEAMGYLTRELESLGFRWAYRTVDSRFTGTPQRRHRVIFVASRSEDPRPVLFSDDAGEPGDSWYGDEAFGFYWTEGRGGLGWAPNGVPPLKGGSTVGIPSPPAIWAPNNPAGRRVVTPSIEEAEALQGFPRGWTEPADSGSVNGPRWKLVGNAVTVGVADWLVSRLESPGNAWLEDRATPHKSPKWPSAAFGSEGRVHAMDASAWPRRTPYIPITQVVDLRDATPLSHRATAGFLSRVAKSSLHFVEEFLLDVKEHLEETRTQPALEVG